MTDQSTVDFAFHRQTRQLVGEIGSIKLLKPRFNTTGRFCSDVQENRAS